MTSAPIHPGAYADANLYRNLPPLDQLARVRLAPWLGAHGVFLVTADEAAASGLPAEVLVPALDTDDIVGGRIGGATRYAIRTSPSAPPCAAVAAHLERNMHRMAERGRRGKSWMPPEGFHEGQPG